MTYAEPKTRATYDFYRCIHKALRGAHCGFMMRLGQSDPGDAAVVTTLLADLREHLTFCAGHLHHEDVEIHPALDARSPGAAFVLESDHEHHRETFVALEAAIARVEAGEPGALHALYLAFSVYMAEDLEHMAREEREILPVLQTLFTNEELTAIEGRILASLPPEHSLYALQRMLPAANRHDRAMLLGGAKATAPAEVFAMIIDHAAKPTLDAKAWDDLVTDLAL